MSFLHKATNPYGGETTYTLEGEATSINVVYETYITGWDIPVCWAVSEDMSRFWMNNAHGGDLMEVSRSDLLGWADRGRVHECDRKRIYDALGEPYEPEWARKARAAGWTPPAEKKGA